ncbi:MAG: arginase [Fimbriimonadaceae bacterium]|nr:arginase [Fimbriimonadaceae bacterium]
MVDLIAAPFDWCGRLSGSRLGPIAMRMAGLRAAIEGQGETVRHDLNSEPLTADQPLNRDDIASFACEVYERLKSQTLDSLRSGGRPLVMGGDHSLSIGSISAALEHTGGDLAVLWIDAHMDLNTPDTSPSGNLHGMPVAALSRMGGAGSDELMPSWDRILDQIVGKPGLQGRVGWIGLRDVDPGEANNLKKLANAKAWTMQDVDHRSVSGVMAEVDAWLKASGAKNLWISFDVDSLDPIYAPGTGTAVRGGFTYREGHMIAEIMHEWFCDASKPYRWIGMDVVEVNPLADQNNETAKMAVEWVASLFGRTVLHRYAGEPVR